MRYKKTGSLIYLVILTLHSPFNIYAQPDANYISTETMLDEEGIYNVMNYQFYDGLGRPFQTATNGAGCSGKFVYSHQNYEGLSRIHQQWLPVIGGENIEILSDLALENYSARIYGSVNYPYSVNTYDALERSVFATTPGKAWHDNNKGKTTEYITNGEKDVIYYTAPTESVSLKDVGYYEPGTLVGEKVMDEDGCFVVVFKDLLGRKVLERRTGNNDTYFVYNDYNQLRYVLSPMYQNTHVEAMFGYEYRYDERGNMVKKILPQCQYIQYWYNRIDKLTFMQDQTLRDRKKYRFMLYDNLGRLAVQGLCTTSHTSMTDGYQIPSVIYCENTDGIGGSHYILQGVPSDFINDVKIELVNYYDDYRYLRQTDYSTRFPSVVVNPTKVCGMITGSIYLTSNNQKLYSIVTYTEKGQVENTYATTLDGLVENTNITYTFTGNIDVSDYHLKQNGVEILSARLANSYYYRSVHLDKPSSVDMTMTTKDAGTVNKTIAKFSYDAFGRLQTITRSGQGGSVVYSYDLHGWTTCISGRHFREELMYADNEGLGKSYYNGNISVLRWQDSGYGNIRGYKFEYDGLNRLTSAVYGENGELKVNQNRYDEVIGGYDLNGNIKAFNRRGLKNNGVYGTVDDVKINYDGNRISNVRDDAGSLNYEGAMDFATHANYNSCRYNDNGALIQDESRGIALIDYDQWNNPFRIQFTNGNVTEYVYSAIGQKLRTTHYTAQPNITVAMGTAKLLVASEILSKDSIDYHGNLIIENGIPSKYLFGGGYVSLKSAKTNRPEIAFLYYDQDILGNNRAVVNEATGVAEQVINYYPFGTPYSDRTVKNPGFQKYKYNGKELDMMSGLNTYDYGARQYNPVASTWDRMDPLCEKYYNVSPYVYCANNPMKYKDLNGDSLTMDMASLEAIYNALPDETNITFRFDNGVLDPSSFGDIARETDDTFIQDLYEIATSKQIVELSIGDTNSYIERGQRHDDRWIPPYDYDIRNEEESTRRLLLQFGERPGKTIQGNLGQTLYPQSVDVAKHSLHNNIQVNINGFATLNQRSVGIAHEFAHIVLFLRHLPHGHTEQGVDDFIYKRQWNVMKRFGYDF